MSSSSMWIKRCRSVENYEKLNKIEEGTYGVVYRARDRQTGEIVALKQLKLSHEREGFPVTSLREINALMTMMNYHHSEHKEDGTCRDKPNHHHHHPHIIPIREMVVGRRLSSVFLVMPFMPHDLRGLMEEMKEPFRLSEVKTLLLQLLSAVAHMHGRFVVHRDLKTSNLLLSHSGHLMVADFGMARRLANSQKNSLGVHQRNNQKDINQKNDNQRNDNHRNDNQKNDNQRNDNQKNDNQTNNHHNDIHQKDNSNDHSGNLTPVVVTLWYRAPEVLLGATDYGWPVDVWSIGCIFAELLTSRPLFPGTGELDQLDRIFTTLGLPTDHIWPGWRHLPHAPQIAAAGPNGPKRYPPYNSLDNLFPALSPAGLDLMKRMLCYDSQRRITAQQAMGHPFFTEAPLPKDPSVFPTWPSRSEGGGGGKRPRNHTPEAPRRHYNPGS